MLNDLILALGLQIAFYYGLTGFASAWYFRRELGASARSLWLKGILPALGGAILFAASFYSAHQFWTPSANDGDVSWWGVGGRFWLGIGAIVIRIPIMIIWNLVNRSYFKGGTMASADDLVAEAEAA